MAVHDFNAQRLYVEADLAVDGEIAVSRDQANYLLNVLRLAEGSAILVFNGRDGEWKARLASVSKRTCTLRLIEQTRPQTGHPSLTYLFAPLKRARLDYMVQKAVEMGVGRLAPVLTRRTVAERVNLDRMRANALEAAEQCGILSLPVIDEPTTLPAVLTRWPSQQPLIFCDESAPPGGPLSALEELRARMAASPARPDVGVLVGPEGGFDPAEREAILKYPSAIAISLGPRIMRADTAAVAALAVVNAVLGDWR
ncbi:MAG: 16S rRNA (uracil(1498)-N(3))-methyltransferase [Hyphomicrobiaceae bacterium]|nr:16S rRNA (uracil(1498)-N(3))-methyltransferase [Hyphomicrobiaceae bacterium]